MLWSITRLGTHLDGLNHLQIGERFYNGWRTAVPGEDPSRPFVVPQTLNVRHGLLIMENLDLAVLAAARPGPFLFALTHAKTRGSTAALIAPAAIL